MYTTLNEILECGPCGQRSKGYNGFSKLLKGLNKTEADDEELSFKMILDINGIKDAVWCLKALDYNERRMFQADVAESVLHIFEEQYPDDDRPRKAIEAARTGTDEERKKARASAYAASASASASAAEAADASASAASAYDASASSAAADASAASAYDASASAAAAADARKQKWQEIERMFIERFCGVAV